MNRPTPPRQDKIRGLGGTTFGWIDHRISMFWDDMSRDELLLYFFLTTVGNQDGCSWYSTRQITKVLKIGPASLIKARKNLEERGLLAVEKDDFSQRTIYQVLPLPIETIEIPRIKKINNIKTTKTEPAKTVPKKSEDSLEDMHLSRIEEIFNRTNN